MWDFWLARDGDLHHIFFLKAPRSLGDPERRHGNATIGHAVSDDLREWRCLPDAMTPGMAGSWDDMATWTGSVIRHGGEWWCFYTAVNWAEKGLVQRIGAATSTEATVSASDAPACLSIVRFNASGTMTTTAMRAATAAAPRPSSR